VAYVGVLAAISVGGTAFILAVAQLLKKIFSFKNKM
jgi:hypothetical protein